VRGSNGTTSPRGDVSISRATSSLVHISGNASLAKRSPWVIPFAREQRERSRQELRLFRGTEVDRSLRRQTQLTGRRPVGRASSANDFIHHRERLLPRELGYALGTAAAGRRPHVTSPEASVTPARIRPRPASFATVSGSSRIITP
jgi:hypothetical protein